ncbi:hypothetical protein GF338_11040 [candidate division WOR-3 bacterium]|nr:hypothetical protein [candidate division WOR-3 bacterium]
MRIQIAAYRKVLEKQISSYGWIRCVIWSAVKSILEGVSYYLELDHLLIRIGLGLIWLGIAAAALTMFLATLRCIKLFKPGKRFRIWLVVQIIADLVLVSQPVLLIFGLFWIDGLLTAASAILLAISGYMIILNLRNAKIPIP